MNIHTPHDTSPHQNIPSTTGMYGKLTLKLVNTSDFNLLPDEELPEFSQVIH
jgi:hypothetical protein